MGVYGYVICWIVLTSYTEDIFWFSLFVDSDLFDIRYLGYFYQHDCSPGQLFKFQSSKRIVSK